jgi:hypothetical protein
MYRRLLLQLYGSKSAQLQRFASLEKRIILDSFTVSIMSDKYQDK